MGYYEYEYYDHRRPAKLFWTSKTVLLNGLLLGVLMAHKLGYIDLLDVLSMLQEGDLTLLMMLAGFNLLLRFVTNGPIGFLRGKTFFLSKTLWTNGLVLTGLGSEFLGYGDFTNVLADVADTIDGFFGAEAATMNAANPTTLLLLSMFNMFLRFQTNSPVRMR